MKGYKHICYLLVLCFSLHGNQSFAQEVKNGLTWYTDINQVCDLSNKEHKPIFAFFTGSDWCIWCHRLEDNVFKKPGFIEWAKKNVILLEVDFPRNKKLPDELAKQNAGLQQAFQIPGYPTCWLFNLTRDSATKKFSIGGLGSLGYPQTDPEHAEGAFMDNLKQILSNNKKS